MSLRYTLAADGKTPVLEPDLSRWARWFERATRSVAQTYIGDVHVSTVFLGLDHDFMGGGPPVLWETMIFGGPHNDAQWRHRSHEEAIAGHEHAVQLASLGPAVPEPEPEPVKTPKVPLVIAEPGVRRIDLE